MAQKKYIPFKVRYDLEERAGKFLKFAQGGEENIALIIEPLGGSKLPNFENCRFAIDRSKTLNYFRAMLTAKLGLDDATNTLHLFAGRKLLHEGGLTMAALAEAHRDTDGFLYISYAESNPF